MKRPNVAFCESSSSFKKDTMSGNSRGAFISLDFYTVRKRNYSLETTTCS